MAASFMRAPLTTLHLRCAHDSGHCEILPAGLGVPVIAFSINLKESL